ncbi:hypothetical protein LUZ63_000862 [Rhynchospora breviuscula]|uniref:ATP-dependent DNA helicase n=1 Tax=Rhynchospora breviuscula TaxID=2022672 RepID=A0A9Q0HXB8_9POAL|nr:hypothetical protein LUZ63_000862 [Rhynchospora breviuscula]
MWPLYEPCSRRGSGACAVFVCCSIRIGALGDGSRCTVLSFLSLLCFVLVVSVCFLLGLCFVVVVLLSFSPVVVVYVCFVFRFSSVVVVLLSFSAVVAVLPTCVFSGAPSPSTPTSQYDPSSHQSFQHDDFGVADSPPPQTPPAVPVVGTADRPIYDDFGDLTEIGGHVDLPPVHPTPSPLSELLNPFNGPDSRHFLDSIRIYNSMFAFTSMGVQLYMYDTENEIANRLSVFPGPDRASAPRPHIVQALREMLDTYNPYAQAFRSVRDRNLHHPADSFSLRIVSQRSGDGRQYYAPTASEVVGLVIGDIDGQRFDRDIIVQRQSGPLQQITRNLFPGQQPSDRPDLVCRVFRMKLDQMMHDLRGGQFFGHVSGLIHSVEFQKRGLPHVHIIVWLAQRSNLSDGASTDRVISAELPDPASDLDAYDVVSQFMVHGPCGAARPRSPCMQNGSCSKCFPKRFHDATLMADDGVVVYKRRDTGVTVDKNGVILDNRYVVPYNLNLLFKYHAHINVERCHTSMMIEYLFKYICKGRDRARISLQRNPVTTSNNSAHQGQSEEVIDEVLDYLDCRYLTPHESIWRLFQFHIHYSYPTVERLPIHLPLENNIIFRDSQSLQEVANNPAIQRTKLTAWFELNAVDPAARHLTYPEVTRLYTWHDDGKFWQHRLQGYRLARMNFIPPAAGEVYYVRMLLNCVRGAGSFEELRTVNSILHATFKEACNALGMLDDNTEWLSTMQEAAAMASCQQLRRIFVDMLLFSEVADARGLWESCWNYMGDDILRRIRIDNNNLEMIVDPDILKDQILYELEDILFTRGYSLQYVRLPTPSRSKTFLWKALTAYLRSKGKIVLTVASSGLSSLLLDGVWDEAPMNNKLCFEALDRSMRKIFADFYPLDQHKPFGGITVVPGGDFRQTLPVIPHGSRMIYLQERAIITPKNNAVNILNDAVLHRVPIEQHDYYSCDSSEGCQNLPEDLQTIFDSDMLNTITSGSLPPHKLSLKIGVPVMLLRNMDQVNGLCNGTRMIITNLGTRVLGARIITGPGKGKDIQIPRILFSHKDQKLPFIMKRKQFPVRVSYAMTINKSQGQSLHVGGKIQGIVFANDYQRISTAFTEQNIVEITRFAVDESSKDYQVVDYDYILKITRQTQVRTLPSNQYDIPTYHFDFKRLEDVGTTITYEKAVLDTIARISGFSDVNTVPSLGNARVQTLYLTNERGYTMDVALWADFIDKFDVADLYEKSKSSPIILACNGLQIKKDHNGVYGLKTYTGTRFHFDTAMKEISDYLQQTPFDGNPIVLEATPEMFNRAGPPLSLLPKRNPIKITLQELNALYLDNFTDTYYQCAVRIVRITDPFDWCYEACTGCRRKLDRDDQGFYCTECRIRRRQFIPCSYDH